MNIVKIRLNLSSSPPFFPRATFKNKSLSSSSSSSSVQSSAWSGLQAWRDSPTNEDRRWGPTGPEPPSPPHSHSSELSSMASSLSELGSMVLSTSDPLAKSSLSHNAYSRWRREKLPVGVAEPPSRPARPSKPDLETHITKSVHCMNFHGRLVRVFNACSRVRSLKATKILHTNIVTLGSITSQTLFVYNNILSLYALSGELSSARKLFDKMPHKNAVSYNTMIGAYSRSGYGEEAWEIFSEMRRDCRYKPTEFTFGGLISCESLNIRKGAQLHALVLKNGLFDSNAFVGTALMGLYGKFRLLDEAVRIFEDISCKSLVTWNSMMSLLSHHGFVESCVFLFRELFRSNTAVSQSSFVSVMSAFSSREDLEMAEQIHGLALKFSFDYELTVANSLINMFFKCADLCFAEKIFDKSVVRDVVTWNTVIGEFAKSVIPERAFLHFSKMCNDQVLPNTTTFGNLVHCCTNLGFKLYGEFIHGKVIKSAFGSDVCVGSALVDFYAKCNDLENAHRCFDEIEGRNVVSWNTLISGYSSKFSSTSILLLREMLRSCIYPNEFTFSVVLKSAFTSELQQLHSLTIRMGYHENGYVLSSFITAYAENSLVTDALDFVRPSHSFFPTVPFNISAGIYNKTGQYDETLKLLSRADEPDLVSWNIVIEACAKNNYYEEVFELFKQMNEYGIYPDNYTFVSLISTCAAYCHLALGSSVHGLIVKTDLFYSDTYVCNVLIDMYGKCGSIYSAVKVFDESRNRNLITWTALITALGMNGHAREAIERFREMEFLGIKPDSVALNAALTACRHGGLAREGVELFERVKNSYGVEPDMQHYHSLVDLLAKAGNTSEAERIITSMPFSPSPVIWRSFLQGCNRWSGAKCHIN